MNPYKQAAFKNKVAAIVGFISDPDERAADATALPRVNPRYTTDPRTPNDQLFILALYLIPSAPPGSDPWSMFIRTFDMNIIANKRYLTLLL